MKRSLSRSRRMWENLIVEKYNSENKRRHRWGPNYPQNVGEYIRSRNKVLKVETRSSNY